MQSVKEIIEEMLAKGEFGEDAQSLLPKLQSTVISGERIDYSPGTTMGFEFYEHK